MTSARSSSTTASRGACEASAMRSERSAGWRSTWAAAASTRSRSRRSGCATSRRRCAARAGTQRGRPRRRDGAARSDAPQRSTVSGTPAHVTPIVRAADVEPIADALPGEGDRAAALLDPRTHATLRSSCWANRAAAGRDAEEHRQRDHRPRRHGAQRHSCRDRSRNRRQAAARLRPRRSARRAPGRSSATTSSSRCSPTTSRPAARHGLFDPLADVMRELDPDGVPIPMLLPAVTDARHSRRSASRRMASCR